MKITVIGGGNIGTLMAAELAAGGHDTTMYTSKPDRWQKEISVYNNDDEFVLCGTLSKVTDDLKSAVDGAEVIFITVPAECFNSLSDDLKPFVVAGQMIGVVPGAGGAEFAFESLTRKGCILFGLQRVHSIARLKEYGKSVFMLGRKGRLEIASIPSEKATELCTLVESFFNIPCKALPNYLSVTLTPSNPILHTTRLYSMFKDYEPGCVYPKNFLFYEEWNDDSSDMLFKCDSELQNLCKAIPLDLSNVISLKEYYESPTPSRLTEKIRSIKAFKGITSPMKPYGDGFVPDFSSRYFATDFNFGLKVILEMGRLFGADMPGIETVWEWYMDYNISKGVFKLDTDRDGFVSLYR